MKKVEINEDIMLEIFKGLMFNENVNTVIDEPTAPEEWQGKTIMDILNIEFYSFRHRPTNTEQLIREEWQQKQSSNKLKALDRSFAVFSLGDCERLFSANIDFVSISPTIEFWVQSDKIKLLEKIIQKLQITLNGNSPLIQIDGVSRQASIVLNNLIADEVQENTDFGEMVHANLQVFMSLEQETTGANDWKVEFMIGQTTGETPEIIWHELKITNIVININMTTKGIPNINDNSQTGVLNLAKTKAFSLSFDGLKGDVFIDNLIAKSLSSSYNLNSNITKYDNNEPFIMKMTRNGETFYYEVLTVSHIITQAGGNDNEKHSLTLMEKGGNQ